MLKKTKILIITGPTAIGKSGIAIDIAKKNNAEIISADSMQIYKNMNIGTGKVTYHEMQGVRHHLIDLVEPNVKFSVSDFILYTKEAISDIESRNKNIILCGGTGLYINALINGYNLASTDRDNSIRDKYKKILDEHGVEYLFDILKKKDGESSKLISPNDTKRVIRALEIYDLTGRPKCEQVSKNIDSEFDYLCIVLEQNREELYNKINSRVDGMISDGLIEEVEKLSHFSSCQSMQAIGYKELVEYALQKNNFNAEQGNHQIKTIIDKIKKNSRNYAKRQMTFFRWMKLNKVFINICEKENLFKIANNFYTMSDITI